MRNRAALPPVRPARCDVLQINGLDGVRLVLPAGLDLPNANQGLHYMELHQRKKDIRDAAYTLVTARRPPKMMRANVHAFLHPSAKTTRFDPHNWGDSVKAAIDGAVQAGLLPDDSSKYIPEVRFLEGSKERYWQLELVFIPLEEWT
jgi:hypothetical protein